MFKNAEGLTKTEKITSEDFYTLGKTYAWVLDGASGLTKTKLTTAPTDAKWLVDIIDKNLKEKIEQENDSLINIVQSVMDTVSETFFNTITETSYEKHELPSSTLCLVRINKGQLEYYSIGDSVILIQLKNGEVMKVYNTPLSDMEETVMQRLQVLSKEKQLPLAKCRPFVQDMLVGYRKLKNTEEGYWVFSIENNQASKGLYGEIPVVEVQSVCLLSDGFAQYFEVFDLAKDETEFMHHLEVNSLEVLFKKLKKTQDEDADCIHYPRLKKSDDTTGIYIKL